jgi:hypothetical protein
MIITLMAPLAEYQQAEVLAEREKQTRSNMDLFLRESTSCSYQGQEPLV